MTKTKEKEDVVPKFEDLLDPKKFGWFYDNLRTTEDYGLPKQYLFFGRWKSGKTYLAMTAAQVAELSPVLYIDLEESARGTSQHFKDLPIAIQPVSNLNNFEYIIDNLATSKDNPFKTVVIDVLDEAVRWKHEEIDKKYEGRSAYGKDWRELTSWSNDLVMKLRKANVVTLFLAHQKEIIQEDKSVMVVPDMAGSTRELVPGLVDVVGYVSRKQERVKVSEEKTKKQNVTRLNFISRENQSSGSRFEDRLPSEIVNPTMQKIYDALKESK